MSCPPIGKKVRVALIPDVKTMAWHHAREEFLSKELRLRSPDIKGAIVGDKAGERAWIIWTRTWNDDPHNEPSKKNVLYVLRIVVEEGVYTVRANFRDHGETPENGCSPQLVNGAGYGKAVQYLASLLVAAQQEAARSFLAEVQAWNPTPTIVQAAKLACPSVDAIVDRDTDSIASLKWFGPGEALEEVEWIANEKYGWC